MIFKKNNEVKRKKEIQNNSNLEKNLHEKLISETEMLELEEVDDSLELEITFDNEEEDILPIDESIELEDVTEQNDDSIKFEDVTNDVEDITYVDIEEDSEELEIVYDDQDDNLLEIDEALDDSMVKESNAVSFARRWALSLSMSAAAVIIGVSSVVAANIRMKKSSDVAEAAATEATTERFLLLTEDYKNINFKTVSLEAVPENKSVTVNILNEELEPCEGVLFKAVAVKGTVDENRDFLNDVVKHEEIEEFDTSDSVPFIQVNDNDMDGVVTFDNLDESTYTVALLSSAGYNPVEPVEVSTISYEIIDDIIEKVVAESAETIQEDPENNREIPVEETKPAATTAASTTKAPENAGSTVVDVDNIIEVDGDIVYTVSYGDTKQYTSEEINGLPSASVKVTSGDSISELTGYVLSNGVKQVNGKDVEYIKQILVEADNSNVAYLGGFDFSIMRVSTDPTTVANNQNTTGSTTQQSTTQQSTTQQTTTQQSTTQQSTTQQPTTQQPTTQAKKTYRVVNLEPVVEKKPQVVYDNGWQNIEGLQYYYQDGKPVTGWKEIDGIQYYFNGSGVLNSRTVIDVSRFNNSIDWNAVKASGIDYAIIRVGYRGYESGKLVMDSRFEENMQGAIAAGIKVGAYIVTQAVNTSEAVEEASFIVNACKKYNISLPLCIDVESAGGGAGRGDKISVSTRTAVINAFSQTVRSAGYTPMLYASKTWLENKINTGSVYGYCNIWIARYNDTLGYGNRYDMWQFTSSGSVNGISGRVDISAWIR
ncbi:MAG: GH25 family lysozyme [Clostridia bacterium]|nr:GH25 family lysozyme [Clostridia bacterium]